MAIFVQIFRDNEGDHLGNIIECNKILNIQARERCNLEWTGAFAIICKEGRMHLALNTQNASGRRIIEAAKALN